MRWSTFYSAMAVLGCVGFGMEGTLFVISGEGSDLALTLVWFLAAVTNSIVAQRYLEDERGR